MTKFSTNGKKLIAVTTEVITRDRFILGNYTYYFSKKTSDVYEIRRLSNTYNMNVIFSIELKKSQEPSDLNEFEADI